jgi:hypothetical protein
LEIKKFRAKLYKPNTIKCSELMEHIDKLVEIFVRCDDFYQEFEKFLNNKGINYPLKKTLVSKLPTLTQ